MDLIEQQRSPVTESEKLAPLDTAKERLAIGLRKIDGVDERQFEASTGFSIEKVLGPLAARLKDNKLLIRESNSWRLTARGILICDWISGEIIE